MCMCIRKTAQAVNTTPRKKYSQGDAMTTDFSSTNNINSHGHHEGCRLGMQQAPDDEGE